MIYTHHDNGELHVYYLSGKETYLVAHTCMFSIFLILQMNNIFKSYSNNCKIVKRTDILLQLYLNFLLTYTLIVCIYFIRLDVEKVKSFGIPLGPLCAQLKSGKVVTSPSGKEASLIRIWREKNNIPIHVIITYMYACSFQMLAP